MREFVIPRKYTSVKLGQGENFSTDICDRQTEPNYLKLCDKTNGKQLSVNH